MIHDRPVSYDDRIALAETCGDELELSMPCLVDDMANTVDELYAAWPERLYVVDTEGRIAYRGGRGPFGFAPAEVRGWLEARRSEVAR